MGLGSLLPHSAPLVHGASRVWPNYILPSDLLLLCGRVLAGDTKQLPAGRTGGFLAARAPYAAVSMRVREGAAFPEGREWE